MSKTLIPAVGYIRMSSGKQEASPAQQRAEIKKLAKRNGYRIVRWYKDHGISGDRARRPDFERMIADAQEKGDFAAILCWDQDRFGRFDSIEAGRWIYPLREAGVWLVTISQGQIDWNDFAGRMMYGIVQEGKHQFLVDHARNTLRGRVASARRGGGQTTPAYGYDRVYYDELGELVKRVPYGEKFTKPRGWTMRLDTSEDSRAVATVRWMFRTFADTDISIRGLVAELNKRDGNRWSHTGVKYILSNPAYIGLREFGRTSRGKYYQIDEKGDVVRRTSNRAQKPPISKADAHPALIDPETFDRVQRKIADRSQKRTKPRRNDYLLAGVLRCGHCGGVLVGDNGGSNSPSYYRCNTSNRGEVGCRAYRIRQDLLELYVLDFIRDRLLTPKAVEAIKKAIHQRAKEKKGFRVAVGDLKKKIAAMDRKIAKGTENLLLANPDDMEDLSRLLAVWREERGQLQAELERAAANPTGQTADERARRAVCELDRLRTHLGAADPVRVRAVVKAMIDNITLWWARDGRCWRFTRGLLTLNDPSGALEGSL